MNPEKPSGSPIFLPPLQFRDGRDFATSAVGQRKNSLPAIHSGFPFSTVTSGRKFSLPWLMEEAATAVIPAVGETTLNSGIRISARDLSRPHTSSQFEFAVGLHGSLKRDCSLPGQLEDEENVPSSPEEKCPSNTPVSANSEKTIVSASSISENMEGSDRNSLHSSGLRACKWRELWSEAKRTGQFSQNSEVIYTENDYRRSSVVTDQPRFSYDNVTMDEYENHIPYNQGRRFSLSHNGYDQRPPTELPRQMGDYQNFPAGSSTADAKDIRVNVNKAGGTVLPLSSSNRQSVSSDVDQSPNEGLLPQQPQLTCPHCGEQVPLPSDIKPAGSSGCSGTISNLCTYVAMAGVVLIGCVAWAQNGHQMPGGDLKNIFPSRHRSQ